MRQINDNDTKPIEQFLTGVFQEVSVKLENGNLGSRAQRINIVNQINAILTGSINPLRGLFSDAVDSIYYEASEDAEKRLLNADINQNAFSVIELEAVKALYTSLDEIKSGFNQQIEQIMGNGALNLSRDLERFNSEVQRDIANELAKGITTGDSAIKMRTKIEKLIEDNNYKGVQVESKRTASGFINYTIKSAVKRLTQSSLIRASTTAVLERSIERGNDIVRISKHGDPSPMCQPYQGDKFSISGKHATYPSLASVMWDGKYVRGSGIHHPYCRHSLTVAIDTDIQFNEISDEEDEE